MKKITLDKSINGLLYLYIFSLYFFTYVEGLFLISNGVLLLFLLLFWFNHIIKKEKIVFNKFLGLSIVFLFFVLISVLVAVDMNIAFGKLVTMIQIYIMMFTMVNYFDSKEKLYNVIRAFAISGLLATVYLFSVSDFSNIKRFGEELGNQNAIAVILTIAAVFSLVIYNKEKKLWYLLFWLLMVIMIFLTGSRKGFIFILLGSVITFYSSYNINLKTILPVALLIFILLISFYYAIMNIELFYNILGRRIEQMVEGAFGEGTTDGSFNTRMNMIKYGWDWFKEKPLFGYGINNYKVLYSRIGFEETYSHNNVIELLVSVGLIGTIIFYLSYLGVLVNAFKIRKEDRVLILAIVGIIIGYLIMSFGLVFYDSKHIAIIISMASVIPILYKKSLNRSVSIKNIKGCENKNVE